MCSATGGSDGVVGEFVVEKLIVCCNCQGRGMVEVKYNFQTNTLTCKRKIRSVLYMLPLTVVASSPTIYVPTYSLLYRIHHIVYLVCIYPLLTIYSFCLYHIECEGDGVVKKMSM